MNSVEYNEFLKSVAEAKEFYYDEYGKEPKEIHVNEQIFNSLIEYHKNVFGNNPNFYLFGIPVFSDKFLFLYRLV